MKKRIVAALAPLLAGQTLLTVVFTLEFSAAVNLLTGLLGATQNPVWRVAWIIVASLMWITGGVFVCAAETWAQRVRQSSKDYAEIEQGLRDKADRIAPPLVCGVVATFLGFFCLALSFCPMWLDKPSPKQPQTQTRSQPCRIGYQETALYRHVFTAKAKGFFAEEGIQAETTLFASGNQMAQGILSGDLDVAGLANMEVALSVQAKDPNRFEIVNFLVWRTNSFPDYILARKESGLQTLKGFEGKTMGLHPGSAVKGFSKAVLQARGVDLAKVKFLEIQPAMMKDALAAGRVDGLYCMDPVATVLIESGLCTVILANPMQDIFPAPVPISGTAISKKFLKEKPKAAAAVARALERAIKYMREQGHEREIAGYIAQYTPITAEQALRMNVSEYWTLSEFDRSRVQKLADRFVELGIVEKQVDTKEFLAAPDFFEKAQK
jgi:NitT/TauT family transport system substrate-binding protein